MHSSRLPSRSRRPKSSSVSQRRTRRLFVETLEDRRLLTIYISHLDTPSPVNEDETSLQWVFSRSDGMGLVTTGTTTVYFTISGTQRR